MAACAASGVRVRGARVVSLQQLPVAKICVSSVPALCQQHDELFAIFSPLADGDGAGWGQGKLTRTGCLALRTEFHRR